MEKYITAITFFQPSEVFVLRSRLESEGIECLVLNENTVQINPLMSNAVGGIKLQVKESDYQRAIEILNDAGYSPDAEEPQTPFFSRLEIYSAKIPLISRLRFELRLLIIILIATLPCIAFFYYSNRPSAYEILTNRRWCVDNISYQGKNYVPKSIVDFRYTYPEMCNEEICFGIDYTISVPGFNSRLVSAKWKTEGGSLEIFNADTFDFVYNQVYSLDINEYKLVLKSDQTVIHCHSRNIGY